jgi:hypothetical protein
MINVQDSNTHTSSLGQSYTLQVQLYTFATSIQNSSYTYPPILNSKQVLLHAWISTNRDEC